MITSAANVSRFSNLSCKAWALVNPSGTILKSSNIASVTRTALGTYAVAFTTAMSQAFYLVVSEMGRTGGVANTSIVAGQQFVSTTGFYQYIFLNGAASDQTFYIEVYE